MTVDLMGITFHFIDNVHLVGAAYKHLEIGQRWNLADEIGGIPSWR